MQTETMQLWPRGKMIRLFTDAAGNTLAVDDDKPRELTAQERHEVEVNRLAMKYQQEEVLCCDSMLVSALIEMGGGPSEVAEEFTGEQMQNMYPDADDWTLEQCRGWLMDHGIDDHDGDPNPWTMDRDSLVDMIHGDMEDMEDEEKAIIAVASVEQLREHLIEKINDEDEDGLDVWRQAVQDNAEAAEVFEWWRVSEWFADLLAEVGEVVLSNCYGQWWGRCTTGQAFIMDGVLQKAAERHLERIK